MTLQIKSKDDEIKEYHLKRIFELSKKSAKQKPQLEEPTDQQKEWVIRKLKNSDWECSR